MDAAALASFPLTYRADLVRDQLNHLPHGTRRGADAAPPVRAGVTGSGPDLLVLTWSAADLVRERTAGTRLLANLGVTPGMRVANTLPGALATPGALLLGDVIEELGALDVPLGVVDSAATARQAWDLVDRIQPQVMILDDASAPRLFAAAPSTRRGWWCGIVSLQCGPADSERLSIPDAAGFGGWQRTWLAVPEATSFAAYSCATARFHVDAAVVAEVVDLATNTVLPVGCEGTLTLTPLGSDTPLLRYASAVRVRLTAGSCPCGAVGTVIECI